MIDIAWRKQAPSHYDQLSSGEDDFELNEGDGFNWEKGEDPTEPIISDSESGEIPTSAVRTSSSSSRRRSAKERATKRLATDGIIPQSKGYSPSDDEIGALSPENSLHDSYAVTLELSPSELVSPLGDSTTTFFKGKLPPLEPPLHTPRRTGSSTNRGQKQSSGRTVRRRFSLDCKLQKKSLDQSDRVQDNQDAKPDGQHAFLNLKSRGHAFMNKLSPRRRRSMDFSYRSDKDSLKVRTDTGVIVAPLNGDSNHSGTRSMTRLFSPPWSGEERLQRKQRLSSFGSLSSSDHQKTNRTIRRGSLSNNSEKSSRTKPRRRRSMDFSYRSDHNNLSGRTRTDTGVIVAPINDDSNHSETRSMTRLFSPPWSGEERLQRSQRLSSFGSLSSSDHQKTNRTIRRGSLSNNSEKSSRTKPRRRRSMDFSYRSDHNNLSGRTRTDSGVTMSPINDNSNHSGTRSMTRLLSPPPWSGEERLHRSRQRLSSFGSFSSIGEKSNRADSDVEYLQMQFTSIEGTDGCCVIKRRSRSIELKTSQSKPNNPIERSGEKTSKPSPIGRTRSESGESFDANKLAQSENQERLEGKLANQRELKPPTSLRKQKMNEISAIYNQVHERHRRRYSPKRFDDSADE